MKKLGITPFRTVFTVLVVIGLVAAGHLGRAMALTVDEVANPPGSAAAANGWQLAYGDEFNGTSIDRSKWIAYTGKTTGGVGTRSPSALSVNGGAFHITGSNKTAGGMCWCGPTTRPLTYGRWEVRARMQPAKGFGSVALLWPDSGRFPQDGEIDLSEIWNGKGNSSLFNVHYGQANSQAPYTNYADTSQWHDYAVEWQPDHITYFFDGKPMYTITDPVKIPTTAMHLGLQMDVGPMPAWIPPADATTPAHVSYDVDWVHIYH